MKDIQILRFSFYNIQQYFLKPRNILYKKTCI